MNFQLGAFTGATGGSALAVAQNSPGDTGPSPATLSFYTLLKTVIGSVYHSEHFNVEDTRANFRTLRNYLRKADPILVAPKNDGRRRALSVWLEGGQPAVNWDTDAPNPCIAGQPIPQIYPFELARQLSDDLELDEVRCLELVAAAVGDPELRRELESESELGSGYLDASDSAYCAATELFYLERGAISRLLLEVVQGSHEESTLDDERRDSLRNIVRTELLDPANGPTLIEGISDSIVKLIAEARKLNGLAITPVISRRRQFLRSQRFQLLEVLFYLLQSFPSTPTGVGKMIEAIRDLSLDELFFASPPLDAKADDDNDDRPGIIRSISMLQLCFATALIQLSKPSNNVDRAYGAILDEKLGIKPKGDRLGFVPWEVFATPQSDKGQQTRRANHAHYPRQRRLKPEVHAVQGLAWLIYLVTIGKSQLGERACYDLYRNSMEHFAFWWFDKITLNLLHSDACNGSDFRCRPQQMVLQPYLLSIVGTVIGNLCKMLLVDNALPLPPTLHDYKAHRAAVSEREGRDLVSVDEQDCLEELICLCSNFSFLNSAEPLRQCEINHYLTMLAKESEVLVSPSAPEGDHAAVYGLYAVYSHLLSALAVVDPEGLAISPELVVDPNAYYKFWIGAKGSEVRHKGAALSIAAVADELERLKFEASLPADQCKFRTGSLLMAWTHSLSFIKHALQSNSESLVKVVETELFPSISATRNDPPRLIAQLVWLSSSVTPFISKDAEFKLPALRGECFKVLASWARNQGIDPTVRRRDFIWRFLSASDTALLPGIASTNSSWNDPSKVHVNLMKRLEEGTNRPATDGLLCLLMHALPITMSPGVISVDDAGNTTIPDGMGGTQRVGGAAGEEAKALKEWLGFVKQVVEDDFKYANDAEKYKIKARALEVLLMMVESERQDGVFFVMSEMLSRTVLLRAVLSLLTTRNGSDASSELDEYCNVSSRQSIRNLLVVVPPVPEPHVMVNTKNLASKPGVLSLAEPWGWWRQRCVTLALALLEAVAARETKFVDQWIVASKTRKINRASPPHRLSAWLLECADPIPVRAIAYFIGYKRSPILPVLASALMSHLTNSSGASTLLVEALFVHEAQAHGLIGHVANALQSSNSFHSDELSLAWRPSSNIDFVSETDIQHFVFLARCLIHQDYNNINRNNNNGEGEVVKNENMMSNCDVQVAVLEMLLSSLRSRTPGLTLAFFGLDDRIRHKDVFHVLIDMICAFYNPHENDSLYGNFENILQMCKQVEKCYEIMFRLLEYMKSFHILDPILDIIENFLSLVGRSKLFFFIPNLGPYYIRQELLNHQQVNLNENHHYQYDTEEEETALNRIVAWHFHIASLCLSHCCDHRSKRFPNIPRTVVTKLVNNSNLANIQDWDYHGNTSSSLLGGWEQLLDVCFTLAPISVPMIIGDSINFNIVKDLLNHTLTALVDHPEAEMVVAEPLARGSLILSSCLHTHFNLIEITPAGPVQTQDIADTTMKLFLTAFVRRSDLMGQTPPSPVYRGALATAMTSYLFHLTTPFTLQQVMRKTDVQLHNVEAIVDACEQTCALHRSSFTALIKHHCQDLVSILARYGVAESSTPKWRVSSVVLLNMVLTLVCDDDFVAAKVLQVLWADRHLERLLSVATKDTEDPALVYVKAAAISLLVEVSQSDLGRSSLAELGAVTLILRASRNGSNDDENNNNSFMSQYVVIVSNMVQLRSHALTEDVLRFIKAHCETMANNLKPEYALISLNNLRYASALASLLAEVVGSIDALKLEKMMKSSSLVGEQSLNDLLTSSWSLVLKLCSFPCSKHFIGSNEWDHMKPCNEEEVFSSKTPSLPPPPCSNALDGWFDFSVTKSIHWFDLLQSLSLFLRRTAHLTYAPAIHIGALTTVLQMCAHILETFNNTTTSSSSSLSTFNGPGGDCGNYYQSMKSASNVTLESFLGIIVARLDVMNSEEARMLQGALGDGFLDRLTRLHPQSAFGASNESDFYVKKIVRFLQDELQIEPAP